MAWPATFFIIASTLEFIKFMTSKEVKKGRQGPINEFNEQIILLSLARFATGQEFLLTEAFPFIPNLYSQTIFASEVQCTAMLRTMKGLQFLPSKRGQLLMFSCLVV